MSRWLWFFALALPACHQATDEDLAAQDEAAAPASAAPAPSASAPEASCDPGCSSIERCDGGKCVPACPEGEVYVPATGPKGFTMGRGAAGAFDQAHTVILTQPFCMDATEVTVAAYRECMDAGKCTVPQLRDLNSNFREEYHRDKHPLNMVNFEQSTAYCEYRGEALPTEAQFEWASGHGDGRKYPWGDTEPSCELADFTPGGSPHLDPAGDVGCHGGGTSEVKAHPKGKTTWPDGDIFDLGGNVWEWTADCYVPYPSGTVTDPSPQSHPSLHGDCYVRSLRGGGWNRSYYSMRVKSRAGSKKTYRVPGLGFRCVRNPK
ncbi:MAG: formylglycine-generating enzyme family protein [Myxococcales bacterium]|nr:formylglycine-generating enzyme family protein [Myxococcales bacterium]MCB9582422.1 formylglycine-generating enzyme family protein [Polyangiaceae bacterium]